MIKGITFDSQQVSAANMGHALNVLSSKQSGVTQGCTITHDASNIYMVEGYLLLCGRQVQIVGTQTIPLETVTSGALYCVAVFEIDLSKTNTESSFLQGTIKTLSSASGYPSPRQDDIDAGGTIYQYPLARYHATPSGVDSFAALAQAVFTDWLSRSKITLDASTATLTIDLT